MEDEVAILTDRLCILHNDICEALEAGIEVAVSPERLEQVAWLVSAGMLTRREGMRVLDKSKRKPLLSVEILEIDNG